MEEFIGEKIEVEKAETSPRPIRFTWRGQSHEVAEVLHEWVDKGFGGIPPGSRRWYNRRHRRHYVVKDADGQPRHSDGGVNRLAPPLVRFGNRNGGGGLPFEIYLDYANRQKRTWWLLYKLA
jgi:hypothetical protein